MKYPLYLSIALLVALLTACQSSQNSENKSNNQSKEPSKDEVIKINVEAAFSRLGNSRAVFKSTAILEADRQATVTSKTSGIILSIDVEEGDVVGEEQLLLTLESEQQQLDVVNAEALYKKSLYNYERSRTLLDKGLANKESVDNLKFETEALKASLDQAKMNLSYTRVRSPFAGMVAKRHVKIGNHLSINDPVFDVVDLNSLQAKLDVPEHHLSLMRPGLPVLFYFDAYKGQAIDGAIVRVSPVVDPQSGTFNVTVNIDNAEGHLRPGLFAKADVIYAENTDVVLLDKNAIITEDDKSFVYLINDDMTVSKTFVQLGYEMDDVFEITDGVDVDSQVVTTGKNNLTEDSVIEIVNN